jgi:tripartite-type tricarboxylate transporter receptor subunit TctC
VRALAVTTSQRVPALPEVPTFAEAGFPGYEVNAWFGLLARKGTPPAAIEAWNQGVRAALDMQDVRQKLSGWGAIPVGNTPAQFAAYLKAEDQKWARVIRDAGIRID